MNHEAHITKTAVSHLHNLKKQINCLKPAYIELIKGNLYHKELFFLSLIYLNSLNSFILVNYEFTKSHRFMSPELPYDHVYV